MLVKDLPTCESVMWLSFLVHQKISLTVDQAEIHIMAPLLFQFNSDLQHRITDFIGERTFPTDQFFDLQSLLKTIEYLCCMIIRVEENLVRMTRVTCLRHI